MEKYISIVWTLPFSITNTFEDANDKLNIFKNHLLSAINENAPLEEVKSTRRPSPWMQDLHVNALQKEETNYVLKHTRTKQKKYGKDIGIFGIS